jgi:Fe-S oxidoreductase
VHGHCHQKAILGMDGERDVLAGMGLDAEILDAGCCGMAGAFGFEAGEKYEVSIRCGERVLLPRVRSAPRDALIVADGFSCREQIRQTTDRDALHLADVVRMGLLYGPEGPAGETPERAYLPGPADVPVMRPAAALALCAAPPGAALLWAGGRRFVAGRRRVARGRWIAASAVGGAVGVVLGLLLGRAVRRVAR